MKIIVAHEGKQHSFRTAEALQQKGYLYRYITTIYDKPWSLTRIVKHLLRGDAQKKCASHRTEALPDDMVKQLCEGRSLLRLFLSKVPQVYKHFPRYYDWLHDSFGRSVAEYAIKHEVDAVIMYDTNANECWKILKERAPHIKRIMDVTIANRLFMKENYLHDMEQTRDMGLREEQAELWNEANCRRYLAEIEDTDEFLVASNVVKRSLRYSGVSEEKMHLAPYGVDVNKFEFIEKKPMQKPLRMVYVGQVCYRKGIHHLLKVMDRFADGEVQLSLAGSITPPILPLVDQYRERTDVRFLGFVTRDRLARLYQESDVFVFPTLGEGYGMVVLEALSCGVPCIVSDLAGGDDAIEDGVNGFRFKAGDDDDLYEKIRWFIDHPDRLPEMSSRSRQSVIHQDWQSYYDHVTHAIETILGRS